MKIVIDVFWKFVGRFGALACDYGFHKFGPWSGVVGKRRRGHPRFRVRFCRRCSKPETVDVIEK